MSQSPPSAESAEAWGAAARGYAEEVAPNLVQPFVGALADRLDLSGTERVLEVGAGSGALTEVLAVVAASVLATDFAPQMLEVLQERLGDAHDNIECAVMDGQALDVEDSSFDAAGASFSVMLFPDRLKGFSELRRAVRPGGRVAVTGWGGPTRFEVFALFIHALRAAFPDLPPPPGPPPVFSLADPAAFAREMESAGFRDVEIELVEREMVIASADRFWRMATAGAPPIQAMLHRLGAAGTNKLRGQLTADLEARFGSGPIHLRNVATLGSGVAT